MKTLLRLMFVITVLCNSIPGRAQGITINNDASEKSIRFGNSKIQLKLDYNTGANISLMLVNGEKVLEGSEGIYTSIETVKGKISSLQLLSRPLLTVTGNNIVLSGIVYGDAQLKIEEEWHFNITGKDIRFNIRRKASRPLLAAQQAIPVFNFSSINTWDGAFQDYGGLAWFYLFNRKLDTYGVHSHASKFWNSKTGNGLNVVVNAPGKDIGMSYTRTLNDRLAFSIAMGNSELKLKLDTGTNRRRYLQDRTDVWAPLPVTTAWSTESIVLSYFDFQERYGRGNLKGLNGDQVSAVLNTIARIGVIDKQHFGGNSWHTPYGPICLHEQYIAQMGLGINDPLYLKGYQECLDYYREHAIKPSGRVWPRWAYSNEDAMPGQFTDKGFYEAQWGYLLDANPDLVTNVVELYNQTGNKAWVKTHQLSCEKALNWLLQRDSNHNGLVEMITDSHTQKRGSDWIDIIWASYENAFVNAKLYHALVLWAGVEGQLGNASMQKHYASFARQLKTSFNKPVSEGGMWDEKNNCYIHWRDKDGSIHGNNMVIPVNFMAIGYGLCDDTVRKKNILDIIEKQMQQEKLFFWPLCLYSYEKGEGNDWQFPFPNYENGDIFLSWGALGVQVYAGYKPALAIQYVKNVLAQYAKDGLAFQRYGRNKQEGLGDDILSGNSLSVVGLYQGVYGVNPMYNRFYLNPHITAEIAGTSLRYRFRGQDLTIQLSPEQYEVSNGQFTLSSTKDFGFYASGGSLEYFTGANDEAALKAVTEKHSSLSLDIKEWNSRKISWVATSKTKKPHQVGYQIFHLSKQTAYTIYVNGQAAGAIRTDKHGTGLFTNLSSEIPVAIEIVKK